MDCKKILIIDDNPVVLKVLEMTLSAYGYEPFVASNGDDGINIVREERPDLILLDINFRNSATKGPRGSQPWDGFLILDWLHQMEEANGVPILIITGGDPVEYQKRGFGAGVVGILEKPIEPDTLLPIVRQTLGEPVADA
jgi:DNA-binding response OmpR family regulator